MKKEPVFEEAMAQLEEIVAKLESGEETLDESIKLFETGARLAALLNRRLEQAEQKIEKLTAPAEQMETDAPAE